jgi:adenylate cyclase
MNILVKKLLTNLTPRRYLEYLIVDRNFNILETSWEVERFADPPNEEILGKDVRYCFPELFGFEETLIDILEGRQNDFNLKGIARYLDQSTPLYIDILVVSESDDNLKTHLIFLVEDVTEKMVLEQSLVQRINETSLLASALASSKKYLDGIITALVDALIVTTNSGKIKRVNQAAQNLFGYSQADFIDQSISMVTVEKEILLQAMQSIPVGQNELFKDLEIVCQTKAGKKVEVAFSCSSIQTEIEGLQDYIFIGRDITERRRAEKLRAAQYATIHILSESTTISQAGPKILPALCESLGWDVGEIWTPDQYLGTPSRVNGGDRISTLLRCVELWVRPSLSIPEFINVTWQSTFAPGVGLPGHIWETRSPHWINDVADDANFPLAYFASQAGLHGAFGFPILGDSEVLGVMTFFSQEVQEPDENLLQTIAAIGSQVGQFIKRKQAEVALQESEERYRDLFENASDLIQSVSLNGRFLYVNRAWKETLGYSEAEIAEMSVFDILHPDCKTHCRQLFSRVMSGEKINKIEAAFISKNGQKISVEGSINCKFVAGKPVATRAIFRDITTRLQAEEALRQQREQTERLLLNILPAPIADRLKQDHSAIADYFAEVTVLFADIVGFTELSSRISPTELLEILNVIFSQFDELAERHGLEKIKTIGDAYMVVGGIPIPKPDNVQAVAEMALDMQAVIAQFSIQRNQPFSIRIGINTGPVTAGVIGIKKFIYDLWGDTVNIASRMESHGLPDEIQVTDATYQLLKHQYIFEERGAILVKGKGEMMTYLLKGRKHPG